MTYNHAYEYFEDVITMPITDNVLTLVVKGISNILICEHVCMYYHLKFNKDFKNGHWYFTVYFDFTTKDLLKELNV